MHGAVHPDRAPRLSSHGADEDTGRSRPADQRRDAPRDDSSHGYREPKRVRVDYPHSSEREGGERRGWRDVSSRRGSERFNHREDEGHGRPQRWDRRDRHSAANESPDVIRFLSTITTPPPPAARVDPSTPSSAFSRLPTRYVLLQNLPRGCDEAALHIHCHPFHCLRHRFLASSSSASTASCVVEFNERDWSKQFFVVHNDKLKLSGEQQQPVHLEYVQSDYEERGGGQHCSATEKQPQTESAATADSEQEEGEVDMEAEETPATRSVRIGREYDLSSLAAVCGARSSGVLVVSALPPEVQAEPLPHAVDVIRYAFAPFAAVRWTAKERLRESGEVVALVAFYSAADAELAFSRREDVRLLGQPVTVHYARKAPTALTGSAASTFPVVAASAASTTPALQRPSHLPATYSYQAETGYWQDSASALLYHPVTAMYFDTRTQRYLVWDASTQQYALVPYTDPTATASATPSAAHTAVSGSAPPASSSHSTASTTVDSSSAAKPTIRLSLSAATAKALARLPPPPAPTPAPAVSMRQSDASAAAVTIAEASTTASSTDSTEPAAAPSSSSTSSSSPAPPSAPATATAAVPDLSQVSPVLLSPLFDLTRLACLLCQRGFASLPQLERHVEQSQLHAKNIELHEAKQEMKRQRHEEQRRASFPTPNTALTPDPHSHSTAFHGETMAAAAEAVEAEMSVAERLMAKQGWRGAGHGLGKAEQGRTDIVQVSDPHSRAGIGAAPPAPAPSSSAPTAPAIATAGGEGGAEAYKDLIRRKAQERFEAVQSGTVKSIEEGAAAVAAPPPDAARHYLSLLEKARATESEGVEHRRPLMK